VEFAAMTDATELLNSFEGGVGKQCTRCRRVRPFHAFGPDNRNRSGLQSACRECEKARHRQYWPTYHRRTRADRRNIPAGSGRGGGR
jgi:hypothetical protein